MDFIGDKQDVLVATSAFGALRSIPLLLTRLRCNVMQAWESTSPTSAA